MNRPSPKELRGKIRQAKDAVSQGNVFILNPSDIAAVALDLGFDVDSELQTVIMELLMGVSPTNYSGTRPPTISNMKAISGKDLFAFTVKSRRFGCDIYLKYALKNDVFWLVSLHQNKPMR